MIERQTRATVPHAAHDFPMERLLRRLLMVLTINPPPRCVPIIARARGGVSCAAARPVHCSPDRKGCPIMKSATPLAVPAKFRLRACVTSHGWYQVRPFRWDGDAGVLHRVDRLANGAAIRSAVHEQDGVVTMAAPTGLSKTERGRLAVRWHHMLALDWDLSAFHRMCKLHDTLKGVPRRGAGWLLRAGSFWEDAAKTICGTNIAWPQARRVMDRICTLGAPLAETDETAWPEPQDVLHAGEGWLRETGRHGYRAPYMMQLARLAAKAARSSGCRMTAGVKRWLTFLRACPSGQWHRYLAILGHFRPLSIDSLVRYVKAYTPRAAR